MGILRGTSDTIEVNGLAKITEDLGKVCSLKYKVTFKRRTVDEAKSIIKEMQNPDSDVTEASIIRDDIVGWRELQGTGGEMVEFLPDYLEEMLDHFEYLDSLMDAWGRAQMGRIMANAKNS